MKLGAVVSGDVISPADDPMSSRCVYHLLVPVAAITCNPQDLAAAQMPEEKAAIAKLAEHLNDSAQLFPCRLVRMLVKHVENEDHIPDRDGCLYGVVSGLRIILAAVKAGRSHVRAEVLPAYCEAWPLAVRDDVGKICEYERGLMSLYWGTQ
jgi:hypothetical protein